MFNWFAPKVFNQGYLPEEDGHQVFFMEAGSKDGKPVLVFHGGPVVLCAVSPDGCAGAVVRSRREKPRTTPPPTFCKTLPVCLIFWI